MKLFVICAIILSCLSSKTIWARHFGGPMFIPKDAGYFGSYRNRTFLDYQNNLPPIMTYLNYNINYIVTYTPNVSGITDESLLTGKDVFDLTTQVQYFDGLGRLAQTVIVKGSPGLNDIVQPVSYDEYGRQTKNYLPYISSIYSGSYKENGLTEQTAFYTGGAVKCATDIRPFSETIFETSPLNRPLKQYGPGLSWYSGDHSTNMAYQTNVTGEVKLWTISGSSLSSINSYYTFGTLLKTQTIDENGNSSWEYKDMQGKVVLKLVDSEQGALSTYYVYDDFDRLAYVIPPMATSSSYTEGNTDFNELLYSYKYDDKGRMIEKHIPGSGLVCMIYNKIDKLILSQDAKQQLESKWLFTKYDALGRIVMTGIIGIAGSRDYIQNSLDNSETIFWETRNTDSSQYYYTNSSYPQLTDYNALLTINYYDDYAFGIEGKSFEVVSGFDNTASTMTKVLLTGSKVKVLDGNNTWLTDITYYDDKGRPIQAFSKNILNAWDRTTTLYDFTGKVLQSERYHNNSLSITNRFTYDHVGRKKGVYQQTGGNAEVELADYNYNELGQLVKKYLHGNSSNNLQGIDYRYNIRGWLTSINNAKLTTDDINEEGNDAFGEELSYNTGIQAGGITKPAQWNGNISGVTWKIKGPSVDYSSVPVKAYTFEYDKLNRMKLANYGSSYNGATWNDDPRYYNEALSYDVMGNILTLQRNSGNNINLMDDLVYSYASNSNKLMAVTDNSGNAAGFNDAHSGNDYDYDLNGNLTTDNNKGLTINYNYLNLPQTVTKSSQSIDYTYDATGKKLKKTFGGTSHYYIDGIEYEGSTLQFAMTEEGRVRLGTSGSHTYDYFLKDHLGNVRVILKTEDQSGTYSVYPAASMETMTAATESTYYSNLDKVRSFTPVGFTSLKKNEKVAHLKGTDPNKQIGPSITIKVNSGDKISLTAQSFYPDNSSSQRTGLAETALSQLVNAIINPAGLSNKGKAFATDNLKAQGFDKSAGYQNMMNKLPNSDYNNDNNRPKAYLVWMLFDKEMKLVKTGRSSGARQIPEGAGQVKQMAENDIVMDQGGFLTAYTVNESPASVYIDNFQLSMMQGPIQEENTYYPFGMLNTGLSNTGLTDPINNYKYNGKELQTDLDLQWLDYGARFYDPQIGRFHVVDPHGENYLSWTPYNYVANNPILLIDPNGLDWFYQSADGKSDPTWVWHKGDKYNTGIKDDKGNEVVLQGQKAVVVFNGSKNEKLGEGESMNGKGAKLADVKVYGPNGADDIQSYKGFTMSSDPTKFGVVADGDYHVNRIGPQEKKGPYGSEWTLNNRGRVPDDDNFNPAHSERNPAYIDGVFIHRPNYSGWAGTFFEKGKAKGVSEGCLLIAPNQWAQFNSQLKTVKEFLLQLRRK